MHRNIHTYVRMYVCAYIHTYIQTYIHTYIHTYVVRTYIHAHTHTHTHMMNSLKTRDVTTTSYQHGATNECNEITVHNGMYNFKKRSVCLAAVWSGMTGQLLVVLTARNKTSPFKKCVGGISAWFPYRPHARCALFKQDGRKAVTAP